MVSKYCFWFTLHALFGLDAYNEYTEVKDDLHARLLKCQSPPATLLWNPWVHGCMGPFSDGTIPLGYARQYSHQHETKK